MAICGRRVRLRAPEAWDVPLLHAWANDEELWRCLGGWRSPSGLDATEAWVRGLRDDPLNQRFMIEDGAGGAAVGTANLVGIDWRNRHATHGMMLGDAADRGRGLGRDTVMAVMRHAFDELGMERLDSDIIEYNEESLRLYVGRCGWVEEGRQRRWHHRGGRFWDRIIVGVTRDEYRRLVDETGYWG
jgi:RimJ/RimL family protein N-acetyltransferase